MQLHPRLVEDAGRRPALRAAHDGLRPMLAPDAGDLAGDQIERLVPRHRNERLAAAALARPGPCLSQPSRTIGCAMRDVGMHARRDGVDQVRRIGVALERAHADHAAALDLGEERAPVRMIADELHGSAPSSALTPSPACGEGRGCSERATHSACRKTDPHPTRFAASAPSPQGGGRVMTQPNYLIASGLTGEPTAPVIGMAGATNRNS